MESSAEKKINFLLKTMNEKFSAIDIALADLSKRLESKAELTTASITDLIRTAVIILSDKIEVASSQ